MTARQADLIVDASSSHENMGGEPRMSGEILVELGSIAGVTGVGGETYARFAGGEPGIVAIDPACLRKKEFGDWRVEGPNAEAILELVASGRAALADRQFLNDHGLRVGDSVRLTTPSGLFELPIAGIGTISFISPKGHIVISRELYQKLWHDDLINRAYVLVDKDTGVADTGTRIGEQLGDRFRLRVSTNQDMSSWLAENVRRGFGFLDTMAVVTILVV